MSYKKIRVLQLIDTFGTGGAEKIVLSLATDTNHDRFEVIPCALFRSGPLEEDMKAAGITYRVLGLPRRSVLLAPLFLADVTRIVNAVARIVKELSIDILHTHLTHSTLIGILTCRQKRDPPVCATVHSIIFDSQRSQLSPRAWFMDAAIRTTFFRADRIIAVSQRVADAIESDAGIPKERIRTIPNGVSSELFSSKEDRNSLRRTLGLITGRPVLVSVGRLTRPKGYPHLLGALASMSPRERPLTLIVGDGPDRNDLESRIRALDLREDVRLLGNRKDVPALLAAADLFVLASLWEGLPLALLEAMASGLPAVVTSVGENSEVIEIGKSGLVVPPADEAALAEAVRHILSLVPAEREKMGQTARAAFEQRYSLQRFVAAHESLYEEVVNEHSKFGTIR